MNPGVTATRNSEIVGHSTIYSFVVVVIDSFIKPYQYYIILFSATTLDYYRHLNASTPYHIVDLDWNIQSHSNKSYRIRKNSFVSEGSGGVIGSLESLNQPHSNNYWNVQQLADG